MGGIGDGGVVCEMPGQRSALFVGPADTGSPSQAIEVNIKDDVAGSCHGGDCDLASVSANVVSRDGR